MWYNFFFQRMKVAFITCTGMGGGRGTEPSMALFANPYEDLQGWRQTDWNSENLDPKQQLNLGSMLGQPWDPRNPTLDF